MKCRVVADKIDPQIKRCARLWCSQKPMVNDQPPEKCNMNCKSPLVGLGNAVRFAIHVTTLGQSKRVVKIYRRFRLLSKDDGDCTGCERRARKLNQFGDRQLLRLIAWLRYLSPYEKPRIGNRARPPIIEG